MLKMRMISLVLAAFSWLPLLAEASTEVPYYGDAFYQSLQNGTSDRDLISLLQQVLASEHQHRAGQNDLILSNCGGKDCYSHHSIGYDKARQFILGDFYLHQEGNKYAIREVYCETDYGPEKFNGSKSPAPHKIPDNSVINIEHTWPQSRFTSHFPTDMQKSDLHHLFPTDSEMNSVRGNHPFGEVSEDKKILKCETSRFGKSTWGQPLAFEPPAAHRGNVARALFYFSTRYQMQIDPVQEKFLKKWHEEDPVDAEEKERNEAIMELQGNRNPFIDFPELARKISDF
ncbi:MAG: endonuclease I family protein [Pseudobdellovibrionaceae bacterium]